MSKSKGTSLSDWANGQAKEAHKSIWAQVRTTTDRSALDFSEIDAELLKDAITAVINQGDAFVVSMTGDHGAVGIRILSDNSVEKFYDTDKDSVEMRLMAIRDCAKLA